MAQPTNYNHPALSTLERITDGIISLDVNGQIIYINQPAVKLLKINESNPVGQPLNQLVHSTLAQALLDKLNQERTTPVQMELQVKNLAIHVYPSSDGVTILIQESKTNTSTDPKNRKEDTLQEQNEKLQLLTEATTHLLYKNEPKELFDALFHDLAEHLDLDVYFNYVYDSYNNNLKLRNYGGIHESVAKQIEWLELGEAVCGRVAQEQKRIIIENVDTSDNSSVQLIKGLGIKAYACLPLLYYGRLIGTLSFGSRKRSHFTEEEIDLIDTICQHIAAALERTCLILELTEKKEEAEKANQAKTEFLSIISHELRTPLNSIMGFAQILEADPNDPLTPGQRDKVQKLLNSSRHLSILINDIIEISRLNSGKQPLHINQVDIPSTISKCVKMIRALADKKNIKMTSRIDSNPIGTVSTDEKRVTQVLLNLLSNAIKYTPDDGQVMVTCQQENTNIRITVSDTGLGIPAEEQEKIFEPFHRIYHKDHNIEGAGIGLSIVRKFVTELKGEVGVESEPGKGSSFWITLPNQP